ncbi:MAG: Fe-S cluster assembly protein SufD [Verrucomicrobia bacterium]|nr:Fe-S cluster assembly protein SufD [Verrucomicrobiota bacterium]MCH8510671.1 Fe-S cluster assembly protein SufD [Kiritimatiellia bacterium]
MPTLALPPATEPALLPGFNENVLETARSGEPALLQAKRTAAFEAYTQIQNPEAFHEEYRRLDPKKFKFGSFTRLDIPREAIAYNARPVDEHYDVVISVTPDGIAIEDRADVTGGKVTVQTLQQAALDHTSRIEQHLGTAIRSEEPRKFFELNGAFWNVGFHIHVAKNANLPKGILLRYHNDREGTALLPRLLVTAETGAEFALAEQFTSPDGVSTLCISCREFHLAPNANVKLVSLQDWGNVGIHIGEDWARVQRDAKVDLFSMTLGGVVSKMTVGCNVCEPNASAYLGGLFFADRKQHFDQKTLQFHSAPDTYSNMLYKGAVKDKGYSVYQGIIRALKDCIGVDAYQTNNNLVLDPGSRADSIPSLVIDADELACSHGATMGNLDPEQLYYLRSRGISEPEARRMLVLGFFEEVIERVPFEVMRDRLHEVIEEKLNPFARD